MQAVLWDEQQISIKDLPACYAASHSLIDKLQRLGKGDVAGFEETCCQWLDTEPSCLLEKSFERLKQLKTSEIIHAMFVLPLELQRQK